MIKSKMVQVYYAPKKDRDYFSLGAAVDAEAKAIVLEKHPKSSRFDITKDSDYPKMLRRMRFKIRAAYLREKACSNKGLRYEI